MSDDLLYQQEVLTPYLFKDCKKYARLIFHLEQLGSY